jgi:hypothetical protein
MRILICGDSFAITDPEFPGLHWSEKILDYSAEFEVCNLAYGGCSNALIVMQLLQGLKLNPDFVILSFTSDGRYEVDRDITARPRELNAMELADFQQRRYITNCFDQQLTTDQLSAINRWRIDAASENFEKLKNYFYIAFCLQTLQSQNINFAYSLGGFEYQQDYTQLIRGNYLDNVLVNYQTEELATNLWYHSSGKQKPFFHVADSHVHTLFANECIARINSCDHIQ